MVKYISMRNFKNRCIIIYTSMTTTSFYNFPQHHTGLKTSLTVCDAPISVNVHPRIGLAIVVPLLGVLDHVDAVQHGDQTMHGHGAEVGQDGTEDPEQEWLAGEEEPFIDKVEQELTLEDAGDIVPLNGGEAEWRPGMVARVH
jgi:hypothetical protein